MKYFYKTCPEEFNYYKTKWFDRMFSCNWTDAWNRECNDNITRSLFRGILVRVVVCIHYHCGEDRNLRISWGIFKSFTHRFKYMWHVIAKKCIINRMKFKVKRKSPLPAVCAGYTTMVTTYGSIYSSVTVLIFSSWSEIKRFHV